MSTFIGNTEVADEIYVVLTEGDPASPTDPYPDPQVTYPDALLLCTLDAAKECLREQTGPARIAKLVLIEEE